MPRSAATECRRVPLDSFPSDRYYAPRDVHAKTVLTSELKLAPAHVSAAAAERARARLYANLGLPYRADSGLTRAEAEKGLGGLGAWPSASVSLSRTAVCLSLTGDGEGEEVPPLLLRRLSSAAASPEAPTAFVITGQDERRLLLAAPDVATRDLWIRTVSSTVASFFFSPHTLKGTINLARADSVGQSTSGGASSIAICLPTDCPLALCPSKFQVRKSEAPRAPPSSLDIVSHGGAHVFTLCPPSKEEQLRWVCVVAKAISAAKGAQHDGSQHAQPPDDHAETSAASSASVSAGEARAAPETAPEEDDDTMGGLGDVSRMSRPELLAQYSALLARLDEAEARAAAAEAELTTPRLQPLADESSADAGDSSASAAESKADADSPTPSQDAATSTPTVAAAVAIAAATAAVAAPPSTLTAATSTMGLPPPPPSRQASAAPPPQLSRQPSAMPPPPPRSRQASAVPRPRQISIVPLPPRLSSVVAADAPREEQLNALQAQEKVTLLSLRALRSRVRALQAEADAEWKGKVQGMTEQAEERKRQQMAVAAGGIGGIGGGGGGGAGGSVGGSGGGRRAAPSEVVVIPAGDLLPAGGFGGGASAAAAEARLINEELELGKLVLFRYDQTTQATAGDRLLYSVHDPTDLDLIDLGGSAAGKGMRTRGGLTLQKRFDEWRRQFTVKSEAAEWRTGLETLQAHQNERFLATLTLLEVEHPDQAVLALFRLHDCPGEYTSPLKFGDVLLAWAPGRDLAGGLSFADRATINAATVGMLVRWLEKYRGALGRMYRADCASTDQSEDSSVAFGYVHRKLFQTARVL